jgi:hypothetical protein
VLHNLNLDQKTPLIGGQWGGFGKKCLDLS